MLTTNHNPTQSNYTSHEAFKRCGHDACKWFLRGQHFNSIFDALHEKYRTTHSRTILVASTSQSKSNCVFASDSSKAIAPSERFLLVYNAEILWFGALYESSAPTSCSRTMLPTSYNPISSEYFFTKNSIIVVASSANNVFVINIEALRFIVLRNESAVLATQVPWLLLAKTNLI